MKKFLLKQLFTVRAHKNKGISLLETLICISLFSITLLIIYYNYLKFKENNELYLSKLTIINTISKYRDLAYYNNSSFHIKLDFISKKIFIYDNSFTEVISADLPKTINYKIINKEHTPFLHITNITPQGNLGSAFTIYLFDYSNVAQYRIAFYTFSQIKYLTLNIYKNQSVDNATFDNIYIYHYTDDSQNHTGWVKE